MGNYRLPQQDSESKKNGGLEIAQQLRVLAAFLETLFNLSLHMVVRSHLKLQFKEL